MQRKDYFMEVARVYGDYEKLKKRLDAEYDTAVSSGMYSKGYLNGIQRDNISKLQQERNRICLRFGKIREEYGEQLKKEFDLTACRFDTGLKSVLSSGVRLNERELLDLAEKYHGDYGNSRLLHDYAESNGYTLRNIITLEEAELALDNYINLVSNSMGENIFFSPYPDYGTAKIGAEGYYNKSVTPKMDIFKTPTNPDEELAQAVKDTAAEKEPINEAAHNAAFLAGFNGKSLQDVEKDMEEPTPVNLLTDEERRDAEHMSNYYGHNGDISQQELDYLKSQEYKDAVAERDGETP